MFQAKHDGITVAWWFQRGYWLCQRVVPGKKRIGCIGVGLTKDEAFANWKAVYDLLKPLPEDRDSPSQPDGNHHQS